MVQVEILFIHVRDNVKCYFCYLHNLYTYTGDMMQLFDNDKVTVAAFQYIFSILDPHHKFSSAYNIVV